MLIPYARHSRKMTPVQIRAVASSMREFGWTIPILVDEAGSIIAGHVRVAAAELLQWTDAPVVIAKGWTEPQKRAYRILDNRLVETGSWDDAMLALEMQDLNSDDFDLGMFGFTSADLSRMLSFDVHGLTDPDAAPPSPEKVVTQPGDLIELGQHRLLCGDSTNPAHVSRLLGEEVPPVMVTDPPYGVEYDAAWRNDQKGLGNTEAVGKVLNDDKFDWREAWTLFPGSAAYVWHAAVHHSAVQESLQVAGFGVRAQIVWVKSRFAISRGHYHWQHEPCIYAERGDEPPDIVYEHELSLYVVRTGKSSNWQGDRKQSTVWEIDSVKMETTHSTQKPVECMRRPVINNSKIGESVYDPFLGSGTTMIACEIEGRRCFGIELSPAYCDVIVGRWEAYTGKKAKRPGGEGG